MVNKLLCLLCCCTLLFACKKENDSDGDHPPIPEDPIETEPAVLTKHPSPITAAFLGYYEGLPANYSKTTSNYPVIIYMHGMGQRGNGTTQLDFVGLDGLGKSLAEKKLPPNFNVNGKNYSFIYICPQWWEQPTADEVKTLVDSVLKKYRINTKRIYLAGLSAGGVITTEAAGKYPMLFAAISPQAGTTHSAYPTGNFASKCQAIANASLPIWAFHNEFDPTIPKSDTEEFIAKVNSYTPPIPPRYTLFLGQSGHNAWSKAIDPTYKENGKNLFEWLLQYTR